jgi:hypothetical protein
MFQIRIFSTLEFKEPKYPEYTESFFEGQYVGLIWDDKRYQEFKIK